RAGRLRKIGRRDPMVDSTYIDNAAEAHLLAADRLRAGSPASGRAYFLSQGEPRPIWNLINGILAAAGVPPVTRSIPRGLALLAASALERIYRTFPLSGEPPMTRFLAQQLSCAHWFDIRAARRDLGYRPTVSIDEGLIRLEKSFRQPAAG